MNQKQQDILKAARELFVSTGIQGTATADIAKKAGVSNGTLFHYYSNKTKLIEALYDQTVSELEENILVNIEDTQSIDDQLSSLWKNWINWCMKNEKESSYCEQFENSVYFKEKHQVYSGQLKAFIENLTEKGIQQRKISMMPPDFLFELLRSNVSGMVRYLKANPVKYRTPEFMKQAFIRFQSSLST